jgi:UDP-N-acetylglucosamine 2-epimerase (non-hydrolysing)/UDP-GlcNAc3NAcA epimerase
MKLVSIVGGRPQFIKAAMVSRQIRKDHQEIIVHTGQHYDKNMSDIFFEELQIPRPDYNLGVGSDTHAGMTGRIMISAEEVLLKERPDAVIVYGDMNSTLAGALAAAKLHIPVFHVESGDRIGTLTNPEEINRILTDHVSTLLFCISPYGVDNLKKEGMSEKVYLTGNTMYDAFEYYSNKVDKAYVERTVEGLSGDRFIVPAQHYYLTCHRQENTGSDDVLANILRAMEELPSPVVFPVHPRNLERAVMLKEKLGITNTIMTKPVGYLASIFLIKNANAVITDSGGVQAEAFMAKVPCVTLFDRVVWPEVMVGNANQLARPETNDILSKLSNHPIWDDDYQPFGDGHSAEKIHRIINEYFREDHIETPSVDI